MGKGLYKDQEVGVLKLGFLRLLSLPLPTPCPGSWPKAGLELFSSLLAAAATEREFPSLFV